MQFIGAIDQGTTSTRFMLFDREGRIVDFAQKEHRQIFPRPGWVEHDPMEIWQATVEVVGSGLEKAGLEAGDLAAVGLTNQRETIVAWDRQTGRPLHNAVVWQDTRTGALCRRLAGNHGMDRYREIVGLPLATYFSGPKMRWLLENSPEVQEAAGRGTLCFGTVDAWLIWNLTGGSEGGLHATDVTNASRTMLMGIHSLEWDPGMLDALGVVREMLPEIRPSSAEYAAASGILEGVPIAGVLGDQQAAVFGQTCFDPGDAKNTYGTGCFLLLNTGGEAVLSRHGLLTTLAYQVEGQPPVYALEGSVAIAGALVQWLRDNLGLIEQASEVERLAASVPDNGGIYFVPAFSGLFAPYWRSDARGAIVGMTGYAGRGHIARAALEATAYQTREVVDAMQQDSGVPLGRLKVDGGMVRNELLMQFQADILDVPVIRPTIAETTVLGAAYAAGLAVGFWSGFDELRANWQADKTWQPAMEASHRAKLFNGWLKAVERTFDWES